MNRKAVKTSKDEYLFLRQEILQYLNNYQSVRDMMYGSTLTCLGLGLFFEDSIAIGAQYLFLLPLIVIVPSFLVAVNFWKCVAVDACYLRVFYETESSTDDTDASPNQETMEASNVYFRWETRHAELFRLKPELGDKINVQHVPYVVCALVCLILFWWELLSTAFPVLAADVPIAEKIVQLDSMSVIVGTGVTFLCLLVFLRYRKIDEQAIMDGWREVKQAEQNGHQSQ